MQLKINIHKMKLKRILLTLFLKMEVSFLFTRYSYRVKAINGKRTLHLLEHISNFRRHISTCYTFMVQYAILNEICTPLPSLYTNIFEKFCLLNAAKDSSELRTFADLWGKCFVFLYLELKKWCLISQTWDIDWHTHTHTHKKKYRGKFCNESN